jgi:hypothetical protein
MVAVVHNNYSHLPPAYTIRLSDSGEVCAVTESKIEGCESDENPTKQEVSGCRYQNGDVVKLYNGQVFEIVGSKIVDDYVEYQAVPACPDAITIFGTEIDHKE